MSPDGPHQPHWGTRATEAGQIYATARCQLIYTNVHSRCFPGLLPWRIHSRASVLRIPCSSHSSSPKAFPASPSWLSAVTWKERTPPSFVLPLLQPRRADTDSSLHLHYRILGSNENHLASPFRKHKFLEEKAAVKN